MWKRGGQSSALDRAQALLSAKRNSGVRRSTSPAKTQGTVDGSVKTRPGPANTHILDFSDLSDLSSLSSAPENGADTMGSAAPEKTHGRNGVSRDLRPQSSLGEGGSRFLKKAPPLVTNSSHSLVSNSHMQQMPEPRHVSSFQRGSQTAALSRLAQIESRFRSLKQPQEQARQKSKPAHNVTSDLVISPPPEAVTQSLEASIPISAQSSTDQSLKGKRFLKNKAAVAVDGTNTAVSGSPNGPNAIGVSWSKATATVPLVGSETKSVRVAHGVSLESDEEDIGKLLGDSLDSTDNSFLKPEKMSSTKKLDKIMSRSIHSTPPASAVQPLSSSTAAPRSPTSPSHRSSPFRFTGKAQAHFSPSALSPSPSPPSDSPTLSRRPISSRRVRSPQRSVSAMSGRSEVSSLEELFPVQPAASEGLHSEISVVSSEDFKLNVMTLDDLVPATVGFTEETAGNEREEHKPHASGSTERHKKMPEQQQQKEDMLDYQSDFESESRTERNYSASQVSEHLPGDGDEGEEVSEVREEASDSDISQGRTEDDYSSAFSDSSRSYMSQASDHSDSAESLSRSRDSTSPVSHGSRTSSHQLGRRAATRRVLKEAAVQTQPQTVAHTWSTGITYNYMNPPSVAAHCLSAEAVEAFSTYNPAAFVLTEMLKQQLAMTRRFIESSRHLHSSLVRSLEPPNYRYTTLEDTKEYIRMHRTHRLTVEEALKEVM